MKRAKQDKSKKRKKRRQIKTTLAESLPQRILDQLTTLKKELQKKDRIKKYTKNNIKRLDKKDERKFTRKPRRVRKPS